MIVAVAVTKIKTTFMAHKTEKLEEEEENKGKKLSKEIKCNWKKRLNRCSRFGLGAHNLTNRIQLHLPEEICYLSGSSNCVLLFFFLVVFVVLCISFAAHSYYLFFLSFWCVLFLRAFGPYKYCKCSFGFMPVHCLRNHFRSTFSPSFSGFLMIMLLKPVLGCWFFLANIFQHASCLDSVLSKRLITGSNEFFFWSC